MPSLNTTCALQFIPGKPKSGATCRLQPEHASRLRAGVFRGAAGGLGMWLEVPSAVRFQPTTSRSFRSMLGKTWIATLVHTRARTHTHTHTNRG